MGLINFGLSGDRESRNLEVNSMPVDLDLSHQPTEWKSVAV
jgi:hypothetical protein